MEFLHNTGDLPPQLKDSQWLLDLAFLRDLTAKLNEMNPKLQGKLFLSRLAFMTYNCFNTFNLC